MNPIIARIGAIELRWYGLLFATGLLLCAWKAPHYFKLWGLPKHHAERLTLWVPIGMLLGAHYIHLIFYEWDGLFDLSIEVNSLWPLDVHLGRFWALGSGLASHGGGLGCVLALWIFWHRNGKQLGIAFHRYADAVMMVAIWVFPWVRLGNFFNHELVGRVTEGPWAVQFTDWGRNAAGEFVARGYLEPRHPVVLYEAVLYFAELAFATLWFQPRFARKLRPGATFYLFLMIHFSLRFIAEFAKESQGVDDGWFLNMGHLLSLPIVLVCAYLIFGTKRFNILTPLSAEEKAKIDESARLAEEYDERLDAEKSGQQLPESAAKEEKPDAAAARAKARKKGKPNKGRADA
ncbi:prolipoprotein diacylglyceryl transferase [Sandaracinus amylolyticus]|uniref:prolipoprotein diacylglyceryl transferase n=1 Tax=Sandaracinus amylolyticus TaxID=927083 RepID=UPI001F1B42A9|nr:prolipoprotein diacylglyceryl transferase [Sandaracinus amylolyticus]UJR79102.1 Phosphatidylglycerol--prolipoprotein diacylglyceryl transferase [Sandaracinus amylolyticus]